MSHILLLPGHRMEDGSPLRLLGIMSPESGLSEPRVARLIFCATSPPETVRSRFGRRWETGCLSVTKEWIADLNFTASDLMASDGDESRCFSSKATLPGLLTESRSPISA